MVADVAPSVNGRSERQRALGAGIRIVLDGEPYLVPPRKIVGDEKWIELVGQRLLGTIGDLELDLSALLALAGSSTNTLIELVRAYDEGGTLPDLDWIRNNATSQEVQDGFVTLLEHAYPPFGMSRRLIPPEQRARVIGMLVELVAEYLPSMARLGRAAREEADAAPSPSAPSTRSPYRSGGSGARKSSGRR